MRGAETSLRDWHHLLYVENAPIYQPVLEAGLKTAPLEADGLARVFSKSGLRVGARNRPRILDVSCGIGRHSICLAKLGYEVVGFDFSPYFLRTAQRLAKAEGLGKNEVRFCEGDTARILETLQSRGETDFDAIICMDTSIVRPTLRAEIDLLRSLFRLGRPGAILVIETANRDYFLKYRISMPFVQTFSGGKIQRHIRATYDSRKKHVRGEWIFYRKLQNGDLKHLLSVDVESNMHSKPDLRRLLERTGWKYVRSYGSIRRLDRLDTLSFHIVMVARKPSPPPRRIEAF